jgi:hypothetical protein
MKKPPLDSVQVHGLIRGLSGNHILKNSPRSYVNGFVAAALEVYDGVRLRETLQRKFFIPDESKYTDEKYLQSASELSVSRHLKQKEKQGLLTAFECDKKVNDKNKKDVDDYFEVGATRVSIEVKCPLEEQPAPHPGAITIQRAGRTTGTDQTYERIRQELESRVAGTRFEQGKNRDHRLKDCLISAHQKFSSESGSDGFNILFLSCGHFHRMGEWYGCLYARHELFTAESFHPPETYSRVDVVILSSLKYRHRHARNYPAWTLDDVLLLPVINPHSKRRLLTRQVEEGPSAFHHYLKDFARPQIFSANRRFDPSVEAITQVNYFVQERLTSDERTRFFPISFDS